MFFAYSFYLVFVLISVVVNQIPCISAGLIAEKRDSTGEEFVDVGTDDDTAFAHAVPNMAAERVISDGNPTRLQISEGTGSSPVNLPTNPSKLPILNDPNSGFIDQQLDPSQSFSLENTDYSSNGIQDALVIADSGSLTSCIQKRDDPSTKVHSACPVTGTDWKENVPDDPKLSNPSHKNNINEHNVNQDKNPCEEHYQDTQLSKYVSCGGPTVFRGRHIVLHVFNCVFGKLRYNG